MKTRYFGFLLLGAFLLIGAGCGAAMVSDAELEAQFDAALEELLEDEMMEERMVAFHNNYIPTYDFTYDANMYTLALGADMMLFPVGEDQDSVLANNAEVYLLNEFGEVAMSMIYTVEEDEAYVADPGYAFIEADAELAFDAYEDVLFGEIDARRYDSEEMTQYVLLAPKGYYTVTVMEDGALEVAESLTF